MRFIIASGFLFIVSTSIFAFDCTRVVGALSLDMSAYGTSPQVVIAELRDQSFGFDFYPTKDLKDNGVSTGGTDNVPIDGTEFVRRENGVGRLLGGSVIRSKLVTSDDDYSLTIESKGKTRFFFVNVYHSRRVQIVEREDGKFVLEVRESNNFVFPWFTRLQFRGIYKRNEIATSD